MKVGVIELNGDRPRLTSLSNAEIAWRSAAANGDGHGAEAEVDAVVFHVGLEDCEDLAEAIRRIHEVHPAAQIMLAAATSTDVAFASVLSITPQPSSGLTRRLPLTTRELQVLSAIRAGLTNREIALDLGTSLSTVNRHVENILLKLPARNRTQAAAAHVTVKTGWGSRSRPGG